MYHHHRVALLIGFLLLGFPSDWKIQADDCIDLKVYASTVAGCCHHEAFMDTETFDSCFKTTEDQHTEQNVQSVVCAFDCSYRQMGILHGEDEIDLETINTRQAAYDGAYQETIANAANYCIAVKDKIRQRAERVSTTCSSFAVKFHACLVMEVVLHCPAERWNDSPICAKVKSGTPICKSSQKSSSNCITKRQQFEIPSCCQMEPLASMDLLTKCEEVTAADTNPGTDMYDVCLQKCIYEELGAIDGFEAHLEKLYPLVEGFPVDYRNTVHMAIDECSKLVRKLKKRIERIDTKCEFLGIFVDRCLRMFIYDKCPTARWSASMVCTKVRQGVPECAD
ncbi:uncharacterized protein LOC125766920 [Anopheles funestus]|uniref:uncharacterized protein LOC125766920 n=1 Tax=Anopheles funestus TaxID=62324 RepID=UPI0020C68111|nr:uncharacterized protein LOC125766920 [Anopheles funestus]